MKINFCFVGETPEKAESNRHENARRGLPLRPATVPSLAVIGGGPSAATFLQEEWAGDVWAINGTWKWLGNPEAWFFSGDPLPIVAEMAQGAKRAVLASCCDPSVFDAVEDPEMFDPQTIPHGGSTVSTAIALSAIKGYTKVVFWGCEGSFPDGSTTHVFGNTKEDHIIQVDVGGELYLCRPNMLFTARILAGVIRGSPDRFEERSGGLLRAFIEHGDDYDIVAGSRDLAKQLGFI